MHARILAVVIGVVAFTLVATLAVGAFITFSPAGTKSKAPSEPQTIVIVRNPPALDVVWNNFRESFASFGYKEGENIRYIITEVGADVPATMRALTAALEGSSVDLIYTMGITATRAAKELTEETNAETPILFAVVSDPVGGGLVASMQSSGNNLTGVTPTNNLAASKRLEFLKEMLPETKRIVYAYNDEKTSGIVGLRRFAPGLGLELVEKRIANATELTAFLDAFTYREGDAILRASDGVGASALSGTLEIAQRERVPLIGTNAGDVSRGALMSYGANYGEIGIQSSRMADRILRGTPPSNIPIEEAALFEVAVNLETAEAIGALIPQSFLLRVHHIFPE